MPALVMYPVYGTVRHGYSLQCVPVLVTYPDYGTVPHGYSLQCVPVPVGSCVGPGGIFQS